MSDVTVTMHATGESRQLTLKPQGTLIGRSSTCDIVIDSKDVSRHHARLFQDPFGRWLIEDLASSNGTFINGKRIDSCSALSGESAVIGPASLSVDEVLDQPIESDAAVENSNIIVEDFETEVLYPAAELDDSSPEPCPEQLAQIRQRVSELTSLSSLYPEVCRSLAWAPRTVAAVLRLPEEGTPLPKTPEVLACHFGTSPDDTIARGAAASYPSHLAFRVSHRVLDNVRATGKAVMCKSIYSSDTGITISVVDELTPRSVICAPMGQPDGPIDVLYLDVPIDRRMKAGPDEMFVFTCLAAREIAAARDVLAPIHLKSERSALDRELWLARQIQMKMAPTIPTGLTGFEGAVIYKPTIWVDGDFCDLWTLRHGSLAFAMGHIMANGLSAALTISNLRTLLRSTTAFSNDLSEVLNHVNSHLIAISSEKVSATLFLGLLDQSTAEVKYVNAGHPEPILLHAQSGVRTLEPSTDVLLGADDLTVPESNATIPQDCSLVAFTQGVINAQSPNKEQFGPKRLTYTLKTAPANSAQKIADSVGNAVADFQQSTARQNDISILALTRR